MKVCVDLQAGLGQTGGIGRYVRELFRHLVTTRYSFEEGDKKILLIVPIPRELFQKNGDDFRPVFSRDRINGCTIYHTSTFLDDLALDALE